MSVSEARRRAIARRQLRSQDRVFAGADNINCFVVSLSPSRPINVGLTKTVAPSPLDRVARAAAGAPAPAELGTALTAALQAVLTPDHVREFLGDGDDSEMDVSARTGREDRGVDDAQTGHAANAPVVVDDRHRIGRWSHAAGA